MRAAAKKRIMEVIVVVGLVMLALVSLLPLAKSPQTMSISGPTSPYGSGNYSISGYRIPPVNQGDAINLTLQDTSSTPLFMTLFPGEGVPTASPIYSTAVFLNTVNHVERSPQTQAYTVVVVSFNGTTYHLTIQATWSPYSDAANYLAESVFLLILGGGGFYYYREAARREEMEEAALAEVRSRKEKSQGA